jgi:hypothetical protein
MGYLDTHLFYFDREKQEPWTYNDAVKGTQIFGGIGSGKTSGSGRLIAKKFLEHGFGGLVLCGKTEEADDWVKYAQETNRSQDLLVFGSVNSRLDRAKTFLFNPLQYEMQRDKNRGGGQTTNIVNLFMNLHRMGQRLTGSESNESERYWDNALKRCLSRTIDLLKISGQELNVFNMAKIISSAPKDSEEGSFEERLRIMDEGEKEALRQTSFCIDCVYIADESFDDQDDDVEENTEEKDWIFDLVYDYFVKEFSGMHDRARTTVQEMFLGLTDPFNSGILKKHFSEGLNIFPEQTFDGKVIILNFPVKDYLDSGIYAQSIFKLLWQQATERRGKEIEPDGNSKPVFLWIDEAQYFVNEYDMLFQTTARSSRACTVLLTQNISNYYAQMGGKGAESKVDSLLGNLSTKIFHCNTDAVTNEWASKVIGQNFRAIESGSEQYSIINFSHSTSEGYSMQLIPQVLPYEFTLLKTGGQPNDYIVQAVATINGYKWSNGKNFGRLNFKQQFKNSTL